MRWSGPRMLICTSSDLI
ncbi:hypothetical protein [Candidatus Symbiopectobacterium sp.]